MYDHERFASTSIVPLYHSTYAYTYAQSETFSLFLSFLDYQYQKCCMSALTRFGMMASPRCSAPSRGHIAPHIRDDNEKVFTDKLCTVHVFVLHGPS